MSSWLATRWPVPSRGDVGVHRPAVKGLPWPESAATRGDLGDLGDDDRGEVGVNRAAAGMRMPSRTNHRWFSEEVTGGDRLWARNSNFDTFSTKSTLLSRGSKAPEDVVPRNRLGGSVTARVGFCQ